MITEPYLALLSCREDTALWGLMTDYWHSLKRGTGGRGAGWGNRSLPLFLRLLAWDVEVQFCLKSYPYQLKKGMWPRSWERKMPRKRLESPNDTNKVLPLESTLTSLAQAPKNVHWTSITSRWNSSDLFTWAQQADRILLFWDTLMAKWPKLYLQVLNCVNCVFT